MGKQGSEEAGKRGSREAGKQGRHPFLMRCPGVSKDDGCLSERNHKNLSIPQVWSEGKGTNGRLDISGYQGVY